MAKHAHKATTTSAAPAAPAAAALVAPAQPAAPKFAAQAHALPKGKRGQRRFTYTGATTLVMVGTLGTSTKQAIVAAYFAACAAAGTPATYTGLHQYNGSAARNAWRKGWVTTA